MTVRPAALLPVAIAAAMTAAPTPARAEPAIAAVADELARLDGHRVEVHPDGRGYRIVDVAGEGSPLVGVVERCGDALWLSLTDGAVRLRGPLAVPRIAGPGYKVWVIGRRAADGSLVARRLGVLAPPRGAHPAEPGIR